MQVLGSFGFQNINYVFLRYDVADCPDNNNTKINYINKLNLMFRMVTKFQ